MADPAHTGPDTPERRDSDDSVVTANPNSRRSTVSSLGNGELRAAFNQFRAYHETDRRELLARNQELSDKLIEAEQHTREAKQEALELAQRVREAERRLLEAAERRALEAEQRHRIGLCPPGCSVM